MCGRFTLHQKPLDIVSRFGVQQRLFDPARRYNIAPTQQIAVVTLDAHGDGKKALEGYQWGLIPPWAKDDSIGAKMINARSETLLEKPSFRNATKKRRCLVIADGLYEWQKETVGKKVVKHPFHIRYRDSRIFAFAGLWEEWNGPEGPLRSCTIITGEPNDLVAPLHNRLAVILKPEYEDVWLDPTVPVDQALSLLQVPSDEEMEAFEVDKRVGNVKFDIPNCIVPIEDEGGNADSEDAGEEEEDGE